MTGDDGRGVEATGVLGGMGVFVGSAIVQSSGFKNIACGMDVRGMIGISFTRTWMKYCLMMRRKCKTKGRRI
jgi:hypothetical protein